MTVSFRVDGIAVGQGSMRAFVRNGHPVVTHARPASLGSWRQAIAARAADAMSLAGIAMLTGPVGVELRFGLRRPRHHYGSRGTVTPRWANEWPTSPPDADKLLRAVLDALSGVAFVDDSQVVSISLSKHYADSPGVDAVVSALAPAALPASVAPSLGLLEEASQHPHAARDGSDRNGGPTHADAPAAPQPGAERRSP